MSHDEDWLDVDDNPPTEPGWYGTCHFWDQNEGSFPGAHYWNGEEWDERLPFYIRTKRRFETEAEAEAWVEKNDPSW